MSHDIPRAVRDIPHAFDDMRLPPALAESSRPLFDALGLELRDAMIDDPFIPDKNRSRTVARSQTIEVFLPRLANWVPRITESVAVRPAGAGWPARVGRGAAIAGDPDRRGRGSADITRGGRVTAARAIVPGG